MVRKAALSAVGFPAMVYLGLLSLPLFVLGKVGLLRTAASEKFPADNRHEP